MLELQNCGNNFILTQKYKCLAVAFNIIYNKPIEIHMNIRDYIQRYKQSPVSQKVLSNINPVTPQSYSRINYGSPKSDRRRNNFRSIDSGSPMSPSAFTVRKTSLPPIMEERKRQIFDLDLKKSEVLDKFFIEKSRCQKNPSYIQRYKTEGNSMKIQYKLSSRSSHAINLSQIRMKPVDKYFYKLSNIRLAQRLLVVKPSPELSRIKQKKFYLQQKHYRSQISRNYNLKGKSNKKELKVNHAWVE